MPLPLPRHLLLLVSILLLGFTGQLRAAEQANTIFVPLKASSSSQDSTFQATLDEDLDRAVTSRDMRFLARSQAQTSLDYDTAWPPSMAQMRSLAKNTANIDYVVAGNASKLGSTIAIDLIIYDLQKGQTLRTTFAETSQDKQAEAIDSLAKEVTAYTKRDQRIGEIKISGNSRIDGGAIMTKIKNRQGDNYDPILLRRDLKSIFRMGFFDDVSIDVTDGPSGKIITFAVKEKEIIGSVTITGEDKMKEDDIKEIITVSANTIYNPNQVNKSESYIRQIYKEKGYYDTKVITKLSYPKTDYINVEFVITEGKKLYIKEIIFQGNQVFTDKELKKIMSTSEKGFFSWFTESGVLKRNQIREDGDRIGAYYQNNGFVDAQIGEPVIDHKDDALTVTFQIKEGERYKVGQVDLAGDLLDGREMLLRMTNLGEERYFTREVLRNDVLALTDFYAAKGFAFALVDPETKKDPEMKRIDVTFHISKGELVYVNRIIIKGNDRTRDKVIRREIALKEDDIYDASAIKRSTARLKRLDFFEEVNIIPDPTDEDDMMDVLVEVKEKSTGTFSIGAGYSSVDSLMFMGEISQNNFLGRGQRLSFSANIGGTNTRYNLSFTEPHLNDSQLLFGFDVYQWEREYDYYTKSAYGGSLRFGYPLWEKWRAYWSVGTDNSNVYDPVNLYDILEPESWQTLQDIKRTNYATLGATRDTRNRRYSPSKGSRNVISGKHAGGIFSGDAAFSKIEGNTSWYFPVWKSLVFHTKFAAGYVHENEEGKLPDYEKFYLGGLSTVRGFENSSISPIDPNTLFRTGGTKMCYTNQEFIFPLFKDAGLDGVIFYDAGNTWGSGTDMDMSDLRHGAGAGFRWMSPMGPLRLEWGKNLDPLPNEDSSVWDFSIGGSF